MAADLCFPIEIVGGPTDREDDGLARSSRNRYLDPVQREQAVALSRALLGRPRRRPTGTTPPSPPAARSCEPSTGVDLDYFEIRSTDLGELTNDVPAGTPARALIAARVGTTRLIDNLALTIGGPATPTSTEGSN